MLDPAPNSTVHFNNKLYVVFRGRGSETSLYYGYIDSNGGWSGDTQFPRHASQEDPSLAVFGGQLCCVHRGGGSDKSLFSTGTSGRYPNKSHPVAEADQTP
ncbi:hypothetical protein [Nocardia amamiensis]|uniref:hypothetical protein n=1 Tax=Nocardia amamiensis TaxID=404578 RepID=UPI0008378AF1|nr:hypothetical protein [Nocardia amamiensis]